MIGPPWLNGRAERTAPLYGRLSARPSRRPSIIRGSFKPCIHKSAPPRRPSWINPARLGPHSASGQRLCTIPPNHLLAQVTSMGKLSRMNVMVDAEKVRELAHRRGMSESAAVREALELFLEYEQNMAEIREYQARKGY